MQWCHGAPGVVASLASFAPGDEEHEELMRAGGELTWRAGPPAKGANLCHGTAGNGFAFLALLERTGDEHWLTRARAFAMQAAGQVEQAARLSYDMPQIPSLRRSFLPSQRGHQSNKRADENHHQL